MMNTVMFSSQQPDRFPLNPQIALIVNLLVGWLFYFLAAAINQKAIWLGIATILFQPGTSSPIPSFQHPGQDALQPGMLSSILLFLPLSVLFFLRVVQYHGALRGEPNF